MLNQTFTADNFRKIFDYENRKGNYIEGRFFPEVAKITQELKELGSEFRSLKSTKPDLPAEAYDNQKTKLNERKTKLKETKDTLLTEALENVSSTITSGQLKIKFRSVKTPSGKFAYTVVNSDASAYFAIKQLQFNIRKLYKVKQSNRYNIICQLRSLLENNYPKFIIRTDISGFYENIPRDKLLRLINDEPLLTASSKKIIFQLLNEYSRVAKSTKGIPRGIGISAYLAELYLRRFDEWILKDFEISYYARYVDDIIIIFNPKPDSDTSNYLSKVDNKIKQIGLSLNLAKTKTIDILSPSPTDFNYLGYHFLIDDGNVNLSISQNKVENYKKRIESTVNIYLSKSRLNEKKARKLLIKRLRFLTSNTRLLNNKRNAVVGIYFSNSLSTKLDWLDELDDYLLTQISRVTSKTLKARVSSMSFRDGFEQRRFSKYSLIDLSLIVGAWNHVT